MSNKLYQYRGAWMGVRAIARHAGINHRTLNDRLARGMSITAAISEPIKKHGDTNPAGPKPKLYEFRGQQLTAHQIADILGCHVATVYKRRCGNRVLDGEALAQSFNGFPVNAYLITYKGKVDTLAAWARRYKLSSTTIKTRIERGWPVERALRTPLHGGSDTLTFNDQTHTFGTWAKKAEIGISPQTLRHRVERLGWPVERALTEPIREVDQTFSVNGKSLTLPQWAKKVGIPLGTLRSRLDRGWTLERALTVPLNERSCQTYTFKGETLTLAQWSKTTGISKATLRERIRQFGWPIERALTEPVAKGSRPRGHSKTSKPHLGTGPGSTEADFQSKSATG